MLPPVDASVLIDRCNQDDLTLSKALHGPSWNDVQNQTSFLSKLNKKDKEYQAAVVNDYLENWKEAKPENETEQDREQRACAYKAVANSFYDLATDFYEVKKRTFGRY